MQPLLARRERATTIHTLVIQPVGNKSWQARAVHVTVATTRGVLLNAVLATRGAASVSRAGLVSSRDNAVNNTTVQHVSRD